MYTYMNFVVDQFKFLGLNDREVRVFTAISAFGRMNMTKIASRSQLPRTTVDAIVRRLIKQGLISKEKEKGHFVYFLIPNEVADTLDKIEKRFRPKAKDSNVDTKNEALESKINDEKNVITSDFIDFLAQTFSLYAGDRVRIMLSKRTDENIESCTQRFAGYVKLAIKNDVKLEVLVSSEVADVVCGQKEVFPFPRNPDDVRLNIVPVLYGVLGSDMCIFRDKILIINSRKSIIENIEHASYLEISKHLLTLASEVGWSVNLVAWLNKTKSSR